MERRSVGTSEAQRRLAPFHLPEESQELVRVGRRLRWAGPKASSVWTCFDGACLGQSEEGLVMARRLLTLLNDPREKSRN